MYTADAVTALTNRIGWAPPVPPTSKTLTTENAVGASGRLFNSFHAMCIVENVEATMPISNAASGLDELISNATLNAKLTQIREQAARKVLGRVFDTNPLAQFNVNAFGNRVYQGGTDFSVLIIDRAANLDDCMGYQVAYDTLQMMLTTHRSSGRERGIAQSGEISANMQGYRQADGTFVDGILQKLENAYAAAIGIFFATQSGPIVRDKTGSW